MALTRFTIDGNGQIEPNNVTFTRDGRVESQFKMASDLTKVENGMLLVLDYANREVKLPSSTTEAGQLALAYSAEKNYDSTKPGLKNFAITAGNGGCPRMGYLTLGDTFTTNCLAYDSTEYATETALKTALSGVTSVPVYGTFSTVGAIKLTSTKPAVNEFLKVVRPTTLPDGQYAVEFVK